MGSGNGDTRERLVLALRHVCFDGDKTLTRREWGAIGVVAKELREVGATVTDVHERARAWWDKWGESPTPFALAYNWSWLGAGEWDVQPPNIDTWNGTPRDLVSTAGRDLSAEGW